MVCLSATCMHLKSTKFVLPFGPRPHFPSAAYILYSSSIPLICKENEASDNTSSKDYDSNDVQISWSGSWVVH